MDSGNILSDEESVALRESNAATADEIADADKPKTGVRDLHVDHWERIVSDQVPVLESIAERMVSLLKSTGRQFFRDSVEVVAERSQAQRWGTYARNLPVPTSLNVINIKPHDSKGVICVEANFVFTLVDIFFGGSGNGTRNDEHGEFTPMEVRLVRKFTEAVTADMKQAWRPFIDLEFELGESETNPIFASVAAGTDAVSVSGFTFTFGGKELRFEVVLPAGIVEPIRRLRDSTGLQGPGRDSGKWQARLEEDVQDAGLTLRAVLADMPITLRDVLNARPGDVIPTDIPATVRLMADDQPIMTGAFGVSKGMNAVRIDQPVNRQLIGEKYGRRKHE